MCFQTFRAKIKRRTVSDDARGLVGHGTIFLVGNDAVRAALLVAEARIAVRAAPGAAALVALHDDAGEGMGNTRRLHHVSKRVNSYRKQGRAAVMRVFDPVV